MVAIGAAVLALASLGAGAQAANLRVTFHATPGGCVRGFSNHTITRLGISDGSGEIDYVDNVVPDPHTNNFLACFSTATVAPGRTLRATDGSITDLFTIPPLSSASIGSLPSSKASRGHIMERRSGRTIAP
ncbi:MAG: hypothetical protein LH650_03215 [Chloroflexi bacterium]|nr:hypothetical protein [Chloroflexota bacterium]